MRVILLVMLLTASATAAETRVVLVIGAAGTDEYGKLFAEWGERVKDASKLGGAELVMIGGETASEGTDRAQLQQALKDVDAVDQLWLVLIGHGTYDGKTARFNLRGPDVSSADLGDWLKKVPCPVAIVNCSSASGAFMDGLAGEGRIVVTGTKNGFEHNFARFGDFFTSALTDVKADLDKDDQVSLLEAFLFASRRVEEFYADDNRLATEHALLDDNGDGQGTSADWFQGVRVVKQAEDAKKSPDGAQAHQLHLVLSTEERKLSPEQIARRNELEQQLAKLGKQKANMPVDEYYQSVEAIALELAQIYRSE